MAKHTFNIDTYLSLIILETYALTLTRVSALCSARKFHFLKLAQIFTVNQAIYLLKVPYWTLIHSNHLEQIILRNLKQN